MHRNRNVQIPDKSYLKGDFSIDNIVILKKLLDDESIPSNLVSTFLPLSTASQTPLPSPSINQPSSSKTPLSPKAKDGISVFACLKQLVARCRQKYQVKKVDYNTIKYERVEFLLLQFNGDVLFKLPSTVNSGNVKSMQRMDKHYNGHVQIKTNTSNISKKKNLH